MTKKLALQIFRQIVKDCKIDRSDKVMLREWWFVFIDALRDDKKITEKQYNTWYSPF